jgi:capsular polysaccharide transport system ATP-binding protein
MVSHQEGILKELCQAGVLIDQGHAYWFDDVDEALDAYKELTHTGAVSNATH